jgi:hypothetical protein
MITNKKEEANEKIKIFSRLKGKNVELYLRQSGFRYTGKFLDCSDQFVIIEHEVDGRLFCPNIADIQIIKEVL